MVSWGMIVVFHGSAGGIVLLVFGAIGLLLASTDLRRLAAATQSNAHSEAERRLHQILSGMRLRGWVANHVCRCSNGERLELDVAWPSARLCLEVDGKAYHSSALAFERDRVRRNLLMLDGWSVLRFTWAQITGESALVARTIRAALSSKHACRE